MTTVKADWKLPKPPTVGAVPGFYNDGNEIWLHWVHGTEELLPVEIDGVECDIHWPFIEAEALHAELEALGFVNVDP